MRYEEERHARDLHRALGRTLAGSDARVSVEGAGVHWTCTATRGGRTGSVSCFATFGPEYLTSFTSGDRAEAWGRTSSQQDTVAAVARWLAGDGISDLHAAFAFVDRERHALAALAGAAARSHPRLRDAAAEVRHLMCDLHELWFT